MGSLPCPCPAVVSACPITLEPAIRADDPGRLARIWLSWPVNTLASPARRRSARKARMQPLADCRPAGRVGPRAMLQHDRGLRARRSLLRRARLGRSDLAGGDEQSGDGHGRSRDDDAPSYRAYSAGEIHVVFLPELRA